MTIVELAKKLDVSTSTISRALTRPEVVAKATRERVLAAVKAHRFQPNGIARSLRMRKTQTVGIIVPDIGNWFFGALVKAVGDVTKARGYTVLICNSDEEAEGEAHALDALRERQVSGVISCPAGADVQMWRAFTQLGIPVVELDRRSDLPRVDSVTLDDAGAAVLAVDHFVALGHRRIATIAGPPHVSNGRLRLAGVRRALARHGLELPEKYVGQGDFREKSGYLAAQWLLRQKPRPTALFVANSEMTGGAFQALREAGVRVPQEVSLVGFDDARWARYLTPPLTTIRHPTVEMGQRAAELLLSRLAPTGAPRRAQHVVLPPELVVRDSTAPPSDEGKPRRAAAPVERSRAAGRGSTEGAPPPSGTSADVRG